MEFNDFDEALQYCSGIVDWEYEGSENIDSHEDIAYTCYRNDCCIACAINKLGDKASDYSIECECE